MKTITLSYVIPTRNKLEFLREALTRLIAERKHDEEIIVVDGASTDGTKEYLQELYETGRIQQIVSESDCGQAHAVNKGILMAHGELIKLMNDDDALYYPGIHLCREFMVNHPEVDLLGTSGAVIGWSSSYPFIELGRVYEQMYQDWVDKAKPFGFCDLGLLLRRSSLPLLGVFNPSFVRVDAEFTLRATSSRANVAWYTGYTWIRITNPKSNSRVQKQRIALETTLLNNVYHTQIDGNSEIADIIRQSTDASKTPLKISLAQKLSTLNWDHTSIKQCVLHFEICDNWLLEHHQQFGGKFLFKKDGGLSSETLQDILQAQPEQQRIVSAESSHHPTILELFQERTLPIGFNDLKVGQRVKVEMRLDEGDTVVALKISLKAPEDETVIKGLIQSIDYQKNTLHLLNRDFALPDIIEIKDLQRNIIILKDLKVGDRVKLKGRYSELEGFVPEKIKMQESKDFNLGELQGDINKIDQEKMTLDMVGFTVVVNEKTKISQFASTSRADALLQPQRDISEPFTILPHRDAAEQLCAAGLWQLDQPLRLHLGCGEHHFDGYVNIDYPPSQHNVMTVKADICADIQQLNFPDQSVDEVRLHHVFEHFNRVTALAMLIKWHQWLKVGGKLHIETPDLMGSAKTLTANLPLKIKIGVARHLAGDQADAWAYHLDHWFPERFEHTLTKLGFADIKTRSRSWDREPYLSNVEVIAIKSQHLSLETQLPIADELLWESTVCSVEEPTWEVWRKQLRAALSGDFVSSPSNIPATNSFSFKKLEV